MPLYIRAESSTQDETRRRPTTFARTRGFHGEATPLARPDVDDQHKYVFEEDVVEQRMLVN